MTEQAPLDAAAGKAALRARLLSRRRAMAPEVRRVAGAAIAQNLLILAENSTVRTITSYVSFGSEPPTLEANDALRATGRRVLVPLVLDDFDLDWCEYEGVEALGEGPRGGRGVAGLREATGAALGVDAIGSADLVVVPALAVGRDGTRMGRGGGSYDRALGRVAPGIRVVALLYDGELLDTVPAEPHDRRVTAVVTPSGLVDLAP